MLKSCDRWIVKNPKLARVICCFACLIPWTLVLSAVSAPAWLFVIVYLLSIIVLPLGRVLNARKNVLGKAISALDDECDPYPIKETCEFMIAYCETGLDREVIKTDLALFYLETGNYKEYLNIMTSINFEAYNTPPLTKVIYYNNLSVAHIVNDDLASAEVWYDKALKALEGVKIKKARASAESALSSTAADIEYLRGNYEKALEIYQKTEKETARSKTHKSYACAKCHLALGNRAVAEIELKYVIEAGNKLAIVNEAKRLLSENNI